MLVVFGLGAWPTNSKNPPSIVTPVASSTPSVFKVTASTSGAHFPPCWSANLTVLEQPSLIPELFTQRLLPNLCPHRMELVHLLAPRRAPQEPHQKMNMLKDDFPLAFVFSWHISWVFSPALFMLLVAFLCLPHAARQCLLNATSALICVSYWPVSNACCIATWTNQL